MLRELIGFTKEVFALRGAETVQGPRGEKREFNWLTAVCLICRFLRVGETLQGTLTQSATNSMTKVHTSEGHQAKPHQYIRLTALCFGVASRKEHFKSAHFGGRQLAHLLDWLDSLWVLHRTKWKQHTIAQKKTRLPDMHKTQDVCELGATVLPFVWSLFGAASRPKPCR